MEHSNLRITAINYSLPWPLKGISTEANDYQSTAIEFAFTLTTHERSTPQSEQSIPELNFDMMTK